MTSFGPAYFAITFMRLKVSYKNMKEIAENSDSLLGPGEPPVAHWEFPVVHRVFNKSLIKRS